jgi:hypothetical protein
MDAVGRSPARHGLLSRPALSPLALLLLGLLGLSGTPRGYAALHLNTGVLKSAPSQSSPPPSTVLVRPTLRSQEEGETPNWGLLGDGHFTQQLLQAGDEGVGQDGRRRRRAAWVSLQGPYLEYKNPKTPHT